MCNAPQSLPSYLGSQQVQYLMWPNVQYSTSYAHTVAGVMLAARGKPMLVHVSAALRLVSGRTHLEGSFRGVQSSQSDGTEDGRSVFFSTLLQRPCPD